MSNRRKLLSITSLGLLSLLPASSIANAAKTRGRGEWIVPDGVTSVRVKLVDDKNNVVLSREVDVKSGYKFSVEVA
jgi:hypothetical protein